MRLLRGAPGPVEQWRRSWADQPLAGPSHELRDGREGPFTTRAVPPPHADDQRQDGLAGLTRVATCGNARPPCPARGLPSTRPRWRARGRAPCCRSASSFSEGRGVLEQVHVARAGSALQDLARAHVVRARDRGRDRLAWSSTSAVTSRKRCSDAAQLEAHDGQQAVGLGLEVVVERGLADPDLVGDRSPTWCVRNRPRPNSVDRRREDDAALGPRAVRSARAAPVIGFESFG